MCESYFFTNCYNFVIFFYLSDCIFIANLADVFCSGVSSRLTKFPPCTRPGRLSTTRNRCVFMRLQLELFSPVPKRNLFMFYFTCSPEHKTFLFFTGLNNKDKYIFGMPSFSLVNETNSKQ
jgi:hypothetical protein